MSQPDAGAKIRIAEAYGRQPLGFEANHGQTGVGAQDVQFVSRGAGYTLFLRSTEAVLRLRNAPHELRMKLVDSNPTPRVSQEDELPGKSNYIIGSDRRTWHRQIPRYGKVKYQDVYPGVDLVYYGNQQQLEYDFIVAAGADPDAIELAFEGAENIRVDTGGDLLAVTGEGELRLKAPVIYQDIDGRRVEIPGGYRKTGRDRVAFDLGAYDSTRPLVVDPIVVFSTYLGGSGHDLALGIAVDGQGTPYITGYTASVDFPTSGARQPACATNGGGACEDAFITKLGSYSTYFGGTSGDVATAIAVRSDTGEAFVTGWTRSPDFPTANAIDAVFGDDPSRERAFVTKLSSNGSDLEYSTYLGGDEPWVHPNGIALDSYGAAYVAGSASAAQGGPDVFVTKLMPDGSAVAYSNRFGGAGDDVAYGIAVDAEGHASVTGKTDSLDFPRIGQFHPASGGFAAKLVPDGSAFVYSTYLSGAGTGLALAGPHTYVTGVMPGRQWFSPGGPGGGSTDAFVQVLDFGGQWGNFINLGGTGEDRGAAIAIGSAGSLWVTGVTTSTDFPLVNPVQGQVHDLDAFVVRLDANLQPLFSTYLGGSGREQLLSEIGSSAFPGAPGPALAVAIDPIGGFSRPGVAWVAGFTDSIDFPTGGLSPAPQPTGDGSINTFVTAFFDDGVPTKPNLAVTNHPDFPAELEFGFALPYLFEVTNKGPARATDVWFVDKLPADVRVDQVFVVTPSGPQPCNHDDRWVACRVAFTLSQGERVFVVITATPTTVGAQINTAAVLSQGDSSQALGFWLNGFTEDLIWGQDAARDANIDDNMVTTTTVMIPGSADLSVTGSASSDTVMLDGTVTYTLDVENRGPATSTAATLTDTLPAGATLISATQSGGFGTCGGTSVVTCQWPSLSGVARVTIVVRPTTPGTMTNTAVVSGTATDPDNSNNMVTFTTRVNRPPTANAGPDQIVSAGASCQAIVTLNGTGSSDPDGDLLTYTWTAENLVPPPIVLTPGDPSSGTVTGPTPSGPLPLGAHTITLTVNDGHGGTTSDTVVVTVRDVTAPTFSGVPASVTIEQSSASGSAFTVSMPTAADNCTGSIVVSSNAPAVFPAGATTVTFTVADAAGNSATATTTVTVVDTAPPTFSGVPPPMTVEQAGPSGTSVAIPMPVATDAVSGSVAVLINALAIFPRGTTTVTFTARDASGNTATATTTVTVVDTTAPALAVASPQARAYLHSDVVTMRFSASDAGSGLAAGMPTARLDGSVVANGQGISMLTLALGTHNLVLTASDVAGNSRSQTVTFTVAATIDSLISSVNVFAGQGKIDESNTVRTLLAKLNDVKQAAQRGNKTAAINKLQEFIDLVRTQSGRHITTDAAQILIADAQYMIGTLQ